jgi:hypothetical protein
MIAALIILFLYVAVPSSGAGYRSTPELHSRASDAPVARLGPPKLWLPPQCRTDAIGDRVLGATLGLQARQLAQDLPAYETNLRERSSCSAICHFFPGCSTEHRVHCAICKMNCLTEIG